MAETNDTPPIDKPSLFERSQKRAQKDDFISPIPHRLKTGETLETLVDTDPTQTGLRTAIAKKEIGLEEQLGRETAATLITDFWAQKQIVLGRLTSKTKIDDFALAGAAIFDLQQNEKFPPLPYNVWGDIFELNMVVLDLNVYITKED